jgi:hypothetical protein
MVAVVVSNRTRRLTADTAMIGTPFTAERGSMQLGVDSFIGWVVIIPQSTGMDGHTALRPAAVTAFPGALLLHPLVTGAARTEPRLSAHYPSPANASRAK